MLFVQIVILCLTLILTAQVFAANNTRIIGGVPGDINRFPFVAAINVQTPDSTFFCGGTLYGGQWVLTAAQCVDGATLLTIRFGSVSLRKDDPNRLTVATSDYFVHPNYSRETLESDIALIKLRMPLTHTPYIKSVDLLGTREWDSDTELSAVGWGQTSDQDSSLADTLNVAAVSSLSNTECRITYGDQIQDTMVCIEGNYNEGACHGDTGSPLIYFFPSATEHVGVSSFVSGNGCESTDPSGYTKTFPHMTWIWSIIQNV